MASISKSSMTFIKFLVSGFSSKLILPPLFVKRYKRFIPKKCTLRSHLGKSCEVSIVSNNNGCFFKQGWARFVEENKLKERDILLFNVADEKTFEVLVYGPTCCLKVVQPQVQTFNSERVNVSSNPGVSTQNTDCDGAKRRRKRKEPESTDQDMFGNEIPDYRNAKRGRKELEKRKNEKLVGKKMRSNVELTLKRHQMHNVAIPRSFAIQAGLKHRNKTVIEYPKGRTWKIQVWKRKDNAFLSTGWSHFVQANDISAGDKCIFRTVQGKPNFITAEIYKSGTSRH